MKIINKKISYIQQMRKKIGKDALFSPGVSIIVYENQKYLLQLRKDFNVWGLHGGSIELGETFQEAAIRELKEETNLNALHIKMFKIYSGKDCKIIYPNGDVVFAVVMGFIISKIAGEIKENKQEIFDLKWFEEKDLPIDNMMNIDKIFLTDFLNFKKYNQIF